MFYGSQTGTAEEFANRLSKDAHRYGMRGMAADPEEYDLVSARHAPAPSSRAVRSRVLRQAYLDRGDTRAELGKGTGGIGHLLSFVPAARRPPDIKNPWPRCVHVRCLPGSPRCRLYERWAGAHRRDPGTSCIGCGLKDDRVSVGQERNCLLCFLKPPLLDCSVGGARLRSRGGRVLDSNPAPPTAWGTWPSPSLRGLVYRER